MPTKVNTIGDSRPEYTEQAGTCEADGSVPSADVEWYIPKPGTSNKSGQEIHKIDSPKIVRLTADQPVVMVSEKRILHRLAIWWSVLKTKVRSPFAKPERDAFIASFFNEDSYGQSNDR